jgi:predicted transcriptional regulator
VTDNRVPVTVRLSPDGLAEIDKLATAEERDRSSMIRILLREAVAARHIKGARL